MTRLFVSHPVRDGECLGGEEAHYIASVLRMREGEELVLVEPGCIENICEVSSVTSSKVTLRLLQKRDCVSESPLRITLYQSVSKGERMDLTIQKSTELGVYRIVPVFSGRCVVNRGSGSKTERWNKIALEAARQSGRGIVPEVSEALDFGDALREAQADNDLILIPWEEEQAVSLKTALHEHESAGKIAVFIGPEGGYGEDETKAASEYGAVKVTLGRRILRTETAGPAVLSMLLYYKEL